MQSRIARCKETGDTLVEVLIALVIIGVVTVPLLGTLGTALSASSQHRHVATLDTLLKSFAETAKSELELAPPGAGYPTYSACPSASTYALLSTPTPTNGPVGAAVTVFGTGFVGATPSNVTVTVGGMSAAVVPAQSANADTNGNIPITFKVPATLSAGSYKITLSRGAVSASTVSSAAFTVVNSGSPAVTTSPVAGYTLGISSIYSWDSTEQFNPATANPANCTASQDYGLQQINLTAGAPGISDTLSFVVRNPGGTPFPTPTPQVTVVGSPSPGTAGSPITFTASVPQAATGYPVPTGKVAWIVKDPSGGSLTCTGGSPSSLIPPTPPSTTATTTCTISGANTSTVGTYTATATYLGDGLTTRLPTRVPSKL